MFKDVFAGVESEGEIINDIADLEKEGKETLQESQTEKKPEDKKEEEEDAPQGETEEQKEALKEKNTEDNLPFHKHPRFKALVEEKNAYKEKLEELERFKEETETKLKSFETKVESPEIPSWFVEIFGENPEAYAKYQEQNKADREAIKNEVIEEIKKTSTAEETALSDGKKYIEDQVELLKEKGISFDRNSLMKAMNDDPIFDKDGNLDFMTKARLLELENKKDPEKKTVIKNLISDDGAKGGEEQKPRTYKTPEQMRRMPWGSMGS